ncbi:hypothetical protein [Thiosulfativibrio zosterae]|uniref:Uncharacterized protein n=1 Tax=Thiosulfativibrio zosterae TaxID=2675053 RepID=A0A6F8PR33_9GAMM|nr:hypothetical protein [Thiosulfativibrio zosterae]BBP44488.1 hypothetical protein THMIRHAT_22340 [Thiosulfativibrio zosterae]
MKICKLELNLNSNLKNQMDEKDYIQISADAKELLSSNRFDLAAKLLFLRFYENGFPNGFGREVYIEHQKAMNGLYEADGSNKIGEEQFIKAFIEVFNSIKDSGFNQENIVPTAKDKTILDGAHRIASSIYTGKDVVYVDTGLDSLNLNYQFFKDRGLATVYLDAMANEYITYKKEIYLAIVWPTAGQENNQALKELLSSNGSIVYNKTIHLTRNGSLLLVKEAYSEEAWLGNYADGFQGAQNKSSWCFNKEGPVQIYLYETSQDLIELKDKIRAIYGEGKHSIHMTDNKEETVKLANLLFNDNGIHWLNNAGLRDFTWFRELLSNYKSFLKTNNHKNQDFCLDGSSVLAAYAIREPRDLDFIHNGQNEIDTGYKEIGDHNSELTYHPLPKDSLINDPRNFFYYDDVKVLALHVIQSQKKKRNEDKDIEDLRLIKMMIDKGVINYSFKESINIYKSPAFWKGRIKFFLLKTRYFYTKIKLSMK